MKPSVHLKTIHALLPLCLLAMPINGLAQKVEFYTPRTVRIVKDNGAPAEKKSLVVTAQPEKVKVTREENDTAVIYRSAEMTVIVSRGKVTFADKRGNVLTREGDAGFTPIMRGPDKWSYKVKQAFSVEKDEAVYGLGFLQNGKMSQRGENRRMEQGNTEDYTHFYQSIKGYGIYWDNYSPTTFQSPEAGENGEITLESEVGNIIDYYFMFGGNADGVIAEMRHLSGHVPMLPLWTYGFHQSRERYSSQDELLDVVNKYREKGIPFDGIVQDWQYWGNSYLWNAMEFLADGYYNPQLMVDKIHERHAHLSISVWSSFGIGTKGYREMWEKGHLLAFETFPPSGMPQWPPRDDYPSGARCYDPYSEEARDIYWRNLSRLHRLGIDGWWMDSTEPDFYNYKDSDLDFPTAMGSLRSVRNAYPLMTVEGVYNHQREMDSTKRVFIFTRSCFAGQQRTGANTWSGDVESSWESLRRQVPGCLNFTLTANPNVHSDISGFSAGRYNVKGWNSAKDNPQFHELYVRWMQLGVFMPMMRSHGTDTWREIYYYGKKGEPVYDALVAAVKLRYRLLPYIYSQAWQVSRHNDSFMRALFMDFKNDKTTWDNNRQFMFGHSLLVCPVVNALYTQEEVDKSPEALDKKVNWNEMKTYDVYLPKGCQWYDYWTDKKLEGGTTVTAQAPLSRSPLYVRAGSVLPLAPETQYSNENNYEDLTLVVYPGANAHFDLYEDEGDNYHYLQGKYALIPLRWNEKSGSLTIGKRQGSFQGMPRNRRFHVRLAGSDKTQTVNYTGKSIRISLR